MAQAMIVSSIFFLFSFSDSLFGQESHCKNLHFAEVGWTDIAVTTSVAEQIFQRLGYKTQRTLLSVPVTFRAMKDRDIDIFLGYWKPSMDADIKPYLESHDIELTHSILTGAHYTLAVPTYVYKQGVRSFKDLSRYREKFEGRIYGLEPGNDGNRLIKTLLQHDDFGLKNWSLVESSEQAMLAEVVQAQEQKSWIVFLAWEPHPMKRKIDFVYLENGDAFFGRDRGAAEVVATTRFGLSKDCPQVAQILKSLKFTVDEVNELMEAVLEHKKSPDAAAHDWIASHPEHLKKWTQISGEKSETHKPRTYGEGSPWPYRLNFGLWVIRQSEQFLQGWGGPVRKLAKSLNKIVEKWTLFLTGISSPLLVGTMGMCVLVGTQRFVMALGTILGLFLILSLGFWNETIETLVMVILSVGLALVVGLPLGILTARYRFMYRILCPILDMMQTIPTFVYLIPALMLLGLGFTPGLLATFVFIVPVPIRMTYLGITSIPRSLRELGPAFGASYWDSLIKVEIPYAWPTIRTGISQSLLLSLSMVVITALVGADGLGKPVVQALNTVDMAQGIEAGLTIVILAMLVDRIVNSRKN